MRGLVSVGGDDSAAEWIEEVVRGEVDALVPGLAFAEVANAFAVQVRNGAFALADADRALDLVLELPLRRVSLAPLVKEALALAVAKEVSVYDACYLALAEASGSVLVTADRRLAERASNAALLPTRP